MGRDKQEELGRRTSRNSKPAAKPASALWSFHPTKEQQKAINDLGWTVERSLTVIEGTLMNGCTLTLGYHPDRDACYAIVRVKLDKWSEAPAVSAWHAAPSKTLAILAYYLSEVNPDWPDKLGGSLFGDLAW